MSDVSIIIPTYNRADSVTQSIDSVLEQTYDNLELIIVDDCSTDNTEAVVRSYDDSRIRYIRHEENRGGSAARNTGIQAAKGNYFAFLDSDDEWLPEKLEAQIACLKSRSEDWVAVYCDLVKQRSGLGGKMRGILNRAFTDYQGAEGGEELIEYILTMRFPIGAGSTLLVRGDVVQEMGGFDESFQRHQDWEFLIRLLQLGKLAYLDEKLVRLHGTGPPDAEKLEDVKKHFFDTFSDLIEEYETRGVPVTIYHRLHLARNFYYAGEFKRGSKYLRSGFVPDPKTYFTIMWGLLIGIKRTISS